MTITAQVPDLELDLAAAAAAPYTGDAAAETAAADFRRVVFTSPRTQMVVMTLKPGQQIGSEIHPAADQLFMVVSGTGTATLNLEAHPVGPGALIAVPAGTRHNVTAGQGPLRLVTVYAPPQHPAGTVEHEHAGITAQALDLAAAPRRLTRPRCWDRVPGAGRPDRGPHVHRAPPRRHAARPRARHRTDESVPRRGG